MDISVVIFKGFNIKQFYRNFKKNKYLIILKMFIFILKVNCKWFYVNIISYGDCFYVFTILNLLFISLLKNCTYTDGSKYIL